MSEPVMWYEITCPECGTSNMLYYGDPNDLTGYEPEVLECYKCGMCSEVIDDLVDDEEFEDLCDRSDVGFMAPRDYERFEDLPITFEETEREGEWRRTVKRKGTIKELLDIWDIDDPHEDSEMAQVLRHLRRIME